MAEPWLNGPMSSLPTLVAAGAVVGVLYGLFGVGSAFATPLLAALGVPGLAAVASPLPALVPGSAAGAYAHGRSGAVDRRLARRTMIGAGPACILGALASPYLGGPWLLVLSGVVLAGVGIRVIVPMAAPDPAAASSEPDPDRVPRREQPLIIYPLAIGVGLVAGLLANGGGFLLVPLFLLLLGLELREATATSLVIVTVLSIPTLLTHALIGDIAWGVALPFALGLVPGSVLGSRSAGRLPVARMQMAFGVMLTATGLWFVWRQLGVLGLR
jgi:uncharacterized protein